VETLVGDSIRGVTRSKIRSVGRDRLDRFGPLGSVIPYVMCFVSLCSMALMTAEIFDRKEPRRGLDPKALPLQVAPPPSHIYGLSWGLWREALPPSV